MHHFDATPEVKESLLKALRIGGQLGDKKVEAGDIVCQP